MLGTFGIFFTIMGVISAGTVCYDKENKFALIVCGFSWVCVLIIAYIMGGQ